jgi:HD-GYP domain-containing protein (c-di-GMP phosphodiesterase class II)
MAFEMQEPVSGGRRVKRVAAFLVGAVIVCGALAALTLFVDPVAAMGGAIAVLWVALVFSIRHGRAEGRRSDAYVATVKEKYDSIIGVLCGALYLQDDMNVNHKSRVSRLASTIAIEMGLRGEDVRLLQKASILADIGKIEIVQGIISKPGALNDEEWKEMKRHPEHGYRILNGIPALRDASEIVLAQRERFDGQGYPRGLKGDEIPLGARIFALADAYCAMTSDRPHRKKMPHEMALKEILRNSLTQFDPEVVRAFVRCEERGLITEPQDTETQARPVASGVPSAA